MDRQFIDDLLGEFSPEYYREDATNFRHIVRNVLATALACADNDPLKEVCYDEIRKYVSLLINNPELKKLELSFPIPKKIKSGIAPHEYLKKLFLEYGEKSPE